MIINNLKNKIIRFRYFDVSQNLLCGMLGALIMLAINQWITPKQKTIATIDLTQLTQNFIREQQAKNLSKEALQKSARLFGKQLEKNLKIFTEKNHFILLPKEAVIAGSNDYTSVIAKVMETSIDRDENFL